MDSTQVEGGELLRFCSNRWKENGYVLTDRASRACVVVDPGYDGDGIAEAIAERGLSVSRILATHAHFDHIASVSLLQGRFESPPFHLHPGDLNLLRSVNTYTLCFKLGAIGPPSPPLELSDGDSLEYGSRRIKVLHAPGHTPGGCVFEAAGALFSGDLWLRDPDAPRRLPGFDPEALRESRLRVLGAFPPGTAVFPGHGRPITLAEIRRRHHSGLEEPV